MYNCTAQTPCTITRRHRIPAGPKAAPCLCFHSFSQQHCTPRHRCSVCSPPGPPHVPPTLCGCGMGARGRTSTPAAVPVLRVMGSDQRVCATGTEPFRERNFTLGWEGRLAVLPQAGGLPAGWGTRPHVQAHRYGPGPGRGPLQVGLLSSSVQFVSLPTRSTVMSPGRLGQG